MPRKPVRIIVALFLAVFFCFQLPLKAEVRVPEIFGSNMVLQREVPLPVWGWADPGEKVTVKIQDQSKSAEADKQGRWSLKLDPLKLGGPFEMSIEGKNEIKLENVLIGDVWLCSGQSNMEWTMNSSPDSRADIPNVNEPKIRLLQIEKAWNNLPQDSLKAKWANCNPDSVRNFSAVGFYFGKKLNTELDVPIGLINSSWGGTRIEPWTPPVGFKKIEALALISQEVDAKDPNSEQHRNLAAETIGKYREWIEYSENRLKERRPLDPPPAYPAMLAPFSNHQSPTVLYNSMIHPFVPFAMKGAIWYQGESNRGEGMLYAEKMKALIEGWRSVFENKDLGFYFVQLAPYNYGNDPAALAEIWEAQAAVEKSLPKTGMAVINDIGNLRDIHPANKRIVGERLSLLALQRTYGKTDLAAASPELKEMKIEGETLVLDFANAKSLKTRDGKSPDWFEIGGADGIYHKAEAKIEGTKIILKSPNVKKPYIVRFAWDMLAEPNVQNEAGLQLGAFRAGEIPERELLDSLVPQAKNYKVLYSFDPTAPVLADNQRKFVYTTDKSKKITGKIKRVGYFVYLKPKDGKEQFVFANMPSPDQNTAKLGVPVKSTGVRWQRKVGDVNVISNVPGVGTGTFSEGCNVEFWDCNYAPPNTVGIPNASDTLHDFGDQMATETSPGYGSMQLHNFEKKQTIFSFSGFNKGNNADIGIGNCQGQHPDWTFSNSANTYTGGQFIILVEME